MDDATRNWLLSQLGTATHTADLEARYTRLGKARAVAIEVLRLRRADLIAQPAALNVSGIVGVTITENIKAIERLLVELQATGAPLAPDEAETPADDDNAPFGVIRLIERPRR